MYRYTYFDFGLTSDLALPELPVSRKVKAPRKSWRFEFLSTAPALDETQDYHYWQTHDGEPWLVFSRCEAGYLLQFLDTADFWIQQQDRLVQGFIHEGVSRAQMRHLLIDLVLPLACSLEERPVFHGSCVAVGAGAIGFLGATGQGKSTVAAALARKGFGLLTDDCFLLDHRDTHTFRAVANYPGLRLKADTARALMSDQLDGQATEASWKIRWGPVSNGMSFPSTRPNLTALFVLSSEQGTARRPIIEKIPPGQVLPAILPHVFKLDWEVKGLQAHQFEILCDMMLSIPVYSLGYRADPHLALAWLPKLMSFWQEQDWI